MKINISEVLKSDLALFHNEGLEIYNLIVEELKQGNDVQLSFQGLTKCSTQFLNAVIGQLYLKLGNSKLKKLKLEHTEALPLLNKKIDEVIENALKPQERPRTQEGGSYSLV